MSEKLELVEKVIEIEDKLEKYEKALNDIVAHQKLISGNFQMYSTTLYIAQRALGLEK